MVLINSWLPIGGGAEITIQIQYIHDINWDHNIYIYIYIYIYINRQNLEKILLDL